MPTPVPSVLLTMEAANIFCGVQNAQDVVRDSNHLRLTDVKLPGMDEQYVDLRAAGAPISIEVDTLINRLECTFTLAGWNDRVSSLVASWGADKNQYWIFGALRDRSTGAVWQAKASIYGRMGRADPQLWRRGDIAHWAYSIRGITFYELTVNNDQFSLYSWDYFNSKFDVAGNNIVGKINAALNLPVASPTGPSAAGGVGVGIVGG